LVQRGHAGAGKGDVRLGRRGGDERAEDLLPLIALPPLARERRVWRHEGRMCAINRYKQLRSIK
jgi:hypothetical protein